MTTTSNYNRNREDIGSYKPTRAAFTSAPKCARCEKSVYAAEAVQGPASRTYHKFCLKCTSCNKILDAVSLLEHEGDPYCKSCHLKAFGPKGYGYGGSVSGEYIDRLGGTPSPSSSPRRPNYNNSPSSYSKQNLAWSPPNVDEPLYKRPSDSVLDSSPTKSPLVRATSNQGTNSMEEDLSLDKTTPIMENSFGGRTTPSKQFSKSNIGEGQDTCRRCGQVVYFAERILAAGNKWHKRCLRCAKCSKTLDSHLLVKGDLPFCKKCASEESGLVAMGIMSRPGLH